MYKILIFSSCLTVSCLTDKQACLNAGYLSNTEDFDKCMVRVTEGRRNFVYRPSLSSPATNVIPQMSEVAVVIGKDCSSDYDCPGPTVKCYKSSPAYEVMTKGTCVRK